MAADDRAPGNRVAEEDSRSGSHAVDGVFRVERKFGRQSHVGALVTSYNFGSNFNQVASLDTRIELGRNWTLLGQASTSDTRFRGGARLAGPGYYTSIRKNGLHFQFASTYTDRSPGFRSALGYIPRVDIREWMHTVLYRWLALNADYNWGKGINYYPGSGLRPFLAHSTSGSLGLTFRPRPRLSLGESYIYSRLAATREWLPDAALPTGAIFNNHILRSKVNYQFTRKISPRAIFDYNGVLPNSRLVSLDHSKRFGGQICC